MVVCACKVLSKFELISRLFIIQPELFFFSFRFVLRNTISSSFIATVITFIMSHSNDDEWKCFHSSFILHHSFAPFRFISFFVFFLILILSVSFTLFFFFFCATLVRLLLRLSVCVLDFPFSFQLLWPPLAL